MTFVLVVALGIGVLFMQSAIENTPLIKTLQSILSGGPTSESGIPPSQEKPPPGERKP